MSKFKVQSVNGASTKSQCREDFMGRHQSSTIEAPNRAEAFIRIFRQFTESGNEVTVLHADQKKNPLDFTPEDLEAIHSAGILVQTGYPKHGIQIEQIIPL
jgi:hypothetical protein